MATTELTSVEKRSFPEALVTTAFSQLPEIIYWVDSNLRIAGVNSGACRALGYDEIEMLGEHVAKFNPNHSTRRFCEIYSELQANGVDVREGQRRCKNGTLIDVEVSTSLQTFNGEECYFVFARDITERKLVEVQLGEMSGQLALLNRMASMGELASTIAHDLNQPLASIASNCHVMKILAESVETDSMAAPLKAMLSTLSELSSQVVEQSVMAGEMLHRIRNFVSAVPERNATCDIKLAVKQALPLLESNMAQKAIKLDCNLSNQLPLASIDQVQFQYVLLSILRNAIDALTEVPSEQRKLKITSSESGDGKILIEVQDSGYGVLEGDVDRLFTPFWTTRENSTGIGLSTSQSILDRFGGSMRYASPSCGGARFIIELPADRAGEGS